MILYVCSRDTLSKFSRKNGASGKRLEIMHRVVVVELSHHLVQVSKGSIVV